MPETTREASGAKFDERPRDEQDQLRLNAPADVIEGAVSTQINELAGQLDAMTEQLGREARDEKTGPAGRLSRKMADLLAVNNAIGLWQQENTKQARMGGRTHNFQTFVTGLTDAAENGRLSEDISMAILAASSWVDQDYYRSVTAEYRHRDEMAEAIRQEELQELEQAANHPEVIDLNERARRKQQAAQEQASRQTEARAGIERASLLTDIVDLAQNQAYFNVNLAAGSTFTAGDNPDRNGAVRHVGFNRELESTIRNHPQEAPHWVRQPYEAVAFTPVMTTDSKVETYQEEVKAGWRRTEQVTRARTVEDPASLHRVKVARPGSPGETENAVLFQYSFYGDQINRLTPYQATSPDGTPAPRYGYQQHQGGRDGNILQAGLILPESVAKRLQESIREDPKTARDLVEKLILTRTEGRVTKDMWNGDTPGRHAIRPPYENLPPDWKLVMAEPESNDFSVDTARSGSSQVVRTHGSGPYNVEELPVKPAGTTTGEQSFQQAA